MQTRVRAARRVIGGRPAAAGASAAAFPAHPRSAHFPTCPSPSGGAKAQLTHSLPRGPWRPGQSADRAGARCLPLTFSFLIPKAGERLGSSARRSSLSLSCSGSFSSLSLPAFSSGSVSLSGLFCKSPEPASSVPVENSPGGATGGWKRAHKIAGPRVDVPSLRTDLCLLFLVFFFGFLAFRRP